MEKNEIKYIKGNITKVTGYDFMYLIYDVLIIQPNFRGKPTVVTVFISIP